MSGREVVQYDVAIIGAGPAGLAAAVRLGQLNRAAGARPLRVAVLEKAAEVGRHAVSGCVLEPRALDELLPGWRESPDIPDFAPVTRDTFHLALSRRLRVRLPAPLPNSGNFVAGLGALCRWLARAAEGLGIDVLPGFGASEPLWSGDALCGVVVSGGSAEVRAPVTILAEGCRGLLTEGVVSRLGLRAPGAAQSYGIGLKEVWRVRPECHERGLVAHSVGWPGGLTTWAGAFEYHGGARGDPLVHVGYVLGLDYAGARRDPFREFQELKRGSRLSRVLEGGERLEFAARALADGGLQALPQLWFPGGAIVGCAGGMQNVAKIKGVHTAMKSGMLAAEECFEVLQRADGGAPVALAGYEKSLKKSWAWDELHRVRNMRPSFNRGGLLPFMGFSAIANYITRGREPFTFRTRKADHLHTRPAAQSPLDEGYSAPDGKLTFDRASSLPLTGVSHEKGTAHLVLMDPARQPKESFPVYEGIEEKFCPAGVYEWMRADNGGEPKLHINAEDCLHCKTCDIKDPLQNIKWTLPNAPGGPSYKYT